MPRSLLVLILLLVCALGATGAWLGQVVWVVGWDGLAWVSLVRGPETLPSCLFVAVAMLSPWTGRLRGRPWAGAALLALLTALGFGIYQLSAPLITPFFYGRALMFLTPEQIRQVLLTSLAAVAGLGLGFSLMCWSLLRGLAGAVRWWGLLLFAAALVLVCPAAWAVAQVLPALNGSQDFIHAVKMGYPPGCTALLLGLASWWARP